MVENRTELLVPELDTYNINDYAFVRLTPTGIRKYEDHYSPLAQFGVKPLPLKETPLGVQMQGHELMNIFGPAFFDGSREAPFTKVTLDLDSVLDTFDTSIQQGKREIDVNDFVLVELAERAQQELRDRFHNNPLFESIGPFTKMQFHTVAHFFGKYLYNGSTFTPFKRNELYLLKGNTSENKI